MGAPPAAPQPMPPAGLPTGALAHEAEPSPVDRPRDLSAPGAAPPAPAQPELPAWLRDETAPIGTPPVGEDSLPDWLRDEHAGSPTDRAEEADLPAWLRDEATAPPTGLHEPLPAWLAGPPAAPQPDAPAEATEEVPTWLRDLAGESTSAPPDHPGAQGVAQSPTPPSQPAEAAASGVPGWLQASSELEATEGEEEITVEPFSFEDLAEAAHPPEPTGRLPAWLEHISEATTDEADTLPAWLAEPTDQPSDSTPAAEADVPAWLKDLGSPPPTTESGEATTPDQSAPREPSPTQDSAPAAEELPAWLRADTPAAPAQEAPVEELPPWLHEPVGSEPAPAPTEELPAWLKDATPAEPEAGALPAWLRDEAAAAPEAEALPAWLRTSEPATPAQAEQSVAADEAPTMPSASDAELPPWLRDEAGQPLPMAGAPGDSNLPAWLRGATAEPPADQVAPAPEPIPEWLRQAPAAPPAAQVPADRDWFTEADQPGPHEPAPAGESEFFGGAELPAWLRVPEAEPAPEISPADARSLDWLTRLGAVEEEATSTVAAPAVAAPPYPAVVRTPSQLEAIALLERLAADPFPDAAPAPAPAGVSIWRRIGIERVLYLLLLAALLAGLAMPALSADLQTPPAAPGAEGLFQQIQALSENDIVLVGYEWDARRISELRPLEQAVLGHLIQKHVRLVLISTDPQGTLLLFDLRDELVRAAYRPGGLDYILLGYKPGGELALRALAQDFRAVLRSDFRGNDATQSSLATDVATGQPRLTTLDDLALMLVLADDAADVQGWMEQIHRAAPQVPLGFLLPAEAAPIVQPYLKQPQIYHLAGKQGALAYQNLRGADGAPAAQVVRESAQQRLGTLVFIGLLVIGALAVGLATAVTRRRIAS